MTDTEEPNADVEARLAALRSWRPRGDRARWIQVRRRARTQRRRAFARRGAVAAALAVVVGIGVVALGGTDPADVRTFDAPITTNTAPPNTSGGTAPPAEADGFDEWTPGWHDVDTGPVPAGTADVDWAGELLYVAVGDRLFVHDPADSSWVELPAPPTTGAVETDIIVLPEIGAEGTVLALTHRFGEPVQSARLDLGSTTWTEVGVVPDGYEGTGTPSGPRDPNSGRALVWTGERVLDLTAGAVFDPATDAWEPLTLPADLLAFTHLLYSNPVVVGGETVLAHPHRGAGLRWDATANDLEEFAGIDDALVGNVAVDNAVALPVDGRLLLVSGALSAYLDPTTGDWEILDSPPATRAETGCPARAAVVADDAIVWPCGDVDPVRRTDDGWRAVPTPAAGLDGLLGSWTGAGDALVVWHPHADEPDATPTMRVWVADTAAEPTVVDPVPEAWSELDTGWHDLTPPPLTPRTGAALVADDDRLFVVGGWDFLCPPAADCVLPDTDPFRDGAVLDLASGEWAALPDTPFPVVPTSATMVDGALYLRCGSHPTCEGAPMLRLRRDAGRWDELPDIPGADTPSQHNLVGIGGTLYAFADSDERGEGRDHRFDTATEQWVALPDVPLPVLFDRRVVDVDGDPLRVGSSSRDIGFPAARYDATTDSWTTVGELTPPGFRIARVDGLVHREPHFRSASGGVLDPSTGAWESWPSLPDGADTQDIAGVVGANGAAYYWSTAGLVWDRRTGEYREIGSRPSGGDIDAVHATLGDRLVVYGGAVWPDDGAAGFLSDELWVWVP